MGSKKRTSFKTEKEFCSNQWNNTENLKAIENVEHVNPKTQTLFSVSAWKFFLTDTDNCSHAENYNIIINFSILKKVINIASCPESDVLLLSMTTTNEVDFLTS